MTMKMTMMTMTMSEKPCIPLAFLKKRAIPTEFHLATHSYYLFSVFFFLISNSDEMCSSLYIITNVLKIFVMAPHFTDASSACSLYSEYHFLYFVFLQS